MGIFGAAQGWRGGEGLAKRPSVTKFGTVISYLKKIKKIYDLRDTPPEFC